jgi:uncharacterized SAM-binding protein YcdF (DUF218 family)
MHYMQPLFPLIVLGMIVATIQQWRRSKAGPRYWLAMGAIGLFLISWPPTSWLASASLEGRYHPEPFPKGDADAIVVLAGAVDIRRAERPRAVVKYGTYLRCEHAAHLYKDWRPRPVLVCGGAIPEYSIAMRQVLEDQGVPAAAIWTEQRSRDTYENGLYAAQILRAKGIQSVALVTEAYHMYRAVRVFRKQGLIVVPAPCGFRHTRWSLGLRQLLPSPNAVGETEDALHEWGGLALYWARGRI